MYAYLRELAGENNLIGISINYSIQMNRAVILIKICANLVTGLKDILTLNKHCTNVLNGFRKGLPKTQFIRYILRTETYQFIKSA